MILSSVSEYDADNPEGAKGYTSQYLNKKDVKYIAIALGVLAIAAIPIYGILKKNSDKAACKRNLSGIYKAISIYSEAYDGRFPPLYQQGENATPYLEDGKPIVWASVVAELLPSNASFTCPACIEEEYTRINGRAIDTSGREKKITNGIDLTYGMFAAMSTRPSSDFSDPSSTILLSETANNGARDTYNPQPYKLSDGTVVPFDGFCIGWDTGNFEYLPGESQFITRLAFYNTKDANFSSEDVKSRHDTHIHAINVDGSLRFLQPTTAKIIEKNNVNARTWSVR